MEIKIYFTKYCKYCCSSQQPVVNFRIEIHANFDPRYIGNRSFCVYYTGLPSNVRCAPLTCEGAWPSSISCYAVPFFVGSTRRILRSGTLHNKALLLAYICLILILDRTSYLTARSDRNSISVCPAIRGFQVPEYVRTRDECVLFQHSFQIPTDVFRPWGVSAHYPAYQDNDALR